VRPASSRAGALSHVLSSPRVSEKAAMLAAKDVYVFNVPINANKVEVGKAVEALYSVNVIQVRTIRGIGKIVRRGRSVGARNRWKKALVTIKAGQKIDLYQGV
jgi:large subunit ribosomal protein L23